MRRRTWTAAAALAAALAVGGCGIEGASSDAESPAEDGTAGGEEEEEGFTEGVVPEPEGSDADVEAALLDGDGTEVGMVSLTSTGDGTEVRVEVQDLAPGFHGLHVHAQPLCEPDSAAPDDPERTGDFLSAGGHLGAEDSDHGQHAGDLPSLYVTEAGDGTLLVETDAFTVDDIEAQGGAALMVHADRDNFAHIPDRYGGPDEDTLSTGDAGDRIACAVLGE